MNGETGLKYVLPGSSKGKANKEIVKELSKILIAM